MVGPATESRLKRSFAACPRSLPAHTTTSLAGETATVPVQHLAAVALKQRYYLPEAYRPKGGGLRPWRQELNSVKVWNRTEPVGTYLSCHTPVSVRQISFCGSLTTFLASKSNSACKLLTLMID